MEKKNEKDRGFRPWAFIALAMLAGMMFWQYAYGPSPAKLATGDLNSWLDANKAQVELIAVEGKNNSVCSVMIKTKDKQASFSSAVMASNVDELKAWCLKEKVKFSVDLNEMPWWVSWLPLIVLLGIWIFFIRYMRGGAGGIGGQMSVTKSNARTEIPSTKFTDVAGIDEAKDEVQEVVDFLKNPAKFTKVGAKIPKGVLLMGPPGTGKTLLARAVAGEAGVPFFSVGGSEFVELFVGVGAGRVRDLFARAKKNTPCIVFIDEIDAMGRSRGAGVGQSHNEGEQTLNQLFTEMDGFDVNQGIVVLAATNREDVLDPALLRPGRFDRHVQVSRPDVRGREEILKIHTRNKPLADDVDLAKIARGTVGFSGADLEKLANEAAMLAAREGREKLYLDHFWRSQNRIVMGEERHILISPEEKKLVAYHEGGHAIVGAMMADLGCGEPVLQVTVIPRRTALGVTGFLPKEDKYLHSKAYCLAALKTMLGGRVAEEIVFGKEMVTTGAGNDLHRATALVRRMVCDWGMSENLPLRTYGEHQEMVFLGRDLGRERDYSEEMARRIDEEIACIIFVCTEEVRAILMNNRRKLDALAKALLEKETLTGDEVWAIVGGEAEVKVIKESPAPVEPKTSRKDRILRWLKRGPRDFIRWLGTKPWKNWRSLRFW